MWPFTTKQAPAVETKSGISVPEDWLLEMFGAGVAGSSSVSASVAMTVPAVACAVRAISEAVASLDVTVKRKVGDLEVDVSDHPAAKLLTGAANPWLSGFEFIRDIVAEALTNDAGGFGWVNRVGGKPFEIIHYDPGSIGVQYSAKGTGEPTYRLSGKKIIAADVIHLRSGFSRCPLSLARDAIGMAKAMELYAANLWTNSAKPGGYLKSKKSVGDEGVRKMLAGWKAAMSGAGNSGKTGVLWDETEFVQLAMTSVDGQFNESRVFQILEIARAFRVSPGLLFELTRQTWSTNESQSREFITWTLIPWIRALESALNRALLTDDERGEYRIAFDVDDTSQADLTARATAISTLITAKVLNSNEARDWLGMEPRDGGNVYENPSVLAKQQPGNDNKPPITEAA